MIPLPWFRILAALALLAGAVFAYHRWAEQVREEGRAEVRAEWNAERAEQAQAARAAQEEFRRIEQRRQSLQAAVEQRKTDEIATLDRRLAAALGELRNRPDRPAPGGPAAGNSGAAAACTGAQLYRSDAEFLAREAARAQRVLIERDACHDAYDALTVKP